MPALTAHFAGPLSASTSRRRAACSGGSGSVSQVPQRRRWRRSMTPAAAAAPVAAFEEGALQPSTSYSADREDAEAQELALALAKVAWETKGEELVVLHVAPLVFWTRYLVIATVFSRPQLNAMIVKMEQEAEGRFGRTLGPAKQAGRTTWELLDYGDVVVNVMTEQQRQYYDLETLYGAAEEVDLPFLSGPTGAGVDWSTKL